MNVKLLVIGGKNAGRAIPVTGEKFFIGRAEDCHLRPNSDLVSRHHCAIMIDEDAVTIRDFGSRNGTLVNGERVRGEEELHSGDHLQVGPLEFEVLLEISLAAQKRPKVESVEEAAARTVESAAAKTADGDVDIADWLADATGGGDTRSMETSQTGTVAMPTPAAAGKEATPGEPELKEEKPPEKKGPSTKSPSGIHHLKRPKLPDSQSAAAETLRAFFHRK